MTIDDQEKKTRLSQWFAVAAFSTIALVSMTSNFLNKIKDEDRPSKWAVSAVSLTLTFSALAMFANILLKEKFVNTPMEGGLVSTVSRTGEFSLIVTLSLTPDFGSHLSPGSPCLPSDFGLQ